MQNAGGLCTYVVQLYGEDTFFENVNGGKWTREAIND